MKSLYELLGVEKTATTDQIRKAFRKLSKERHPDVGGDAAEFRRINDAAQILTDPERRKRYDLTGRTLPSTVTPDKVKQVVEGTFQSVVDADDDLNWTNVLDKIIVTVHTTQAEARQSIQSVKLKIARVNTLLARLKLKGKGEDLAQKIFEQRLMSFNDEIARLEDAIELAELAEKEFRNYEYRMGAPAEGPMTRAPTLHLGRSRAWARATSAD